jgi:hypothetical protein
MNLLHLENCINNPSFFNIRRPNSRVAKDFEALGAIMPNDQEMMICRSDMAFVIFDRRYLIFAGRAINLDGIRINESFRWTQKMCERGGVIRVRDRRGLGFHAPDYAIDDPATVDIDPATVKVVAFGPLGFSEAELIRLMIIAINRPLRNAGYPKASPGCKKILERPYAELLDESRQLYEEVKVAFNVFVSLNLGDEYTVRLGDFGESMVRMWLL